MGQLVRPDGGWKRKRHWVSRGGDDVRLEIQRLRFQDLPTSPLLCVTLGRSVPLFGPQSSQSENENVLRDFQS